MLTLADFSCCHRNVENMTLAAIQKHTELLPPPLETRQSNRKQGIQRDQAIQILVGQTLISRDWKVASGNWKVGSGNTCHHLIKKRIGKHSVGYLRI
jgi:hypothetical protein